MRAEYHPQGLSLDRPAVVIRGGAALLGATGQPGAAASEAAVCPRCGKSGGECCKNSDSVAFSDEGRQLLSGHSDATNHATRHTSSSEHDDTSDPATSNTMAVNEDDDREDPSKENVGVTEESSATETAVDDGAPKAPGEPLSEKEQQEVQAMRTRDAEVRSHEQAHLAAAGSQAVGGARYETERGPDGGHYAVAGEVKIRFGGSTPEERLQQAETAQRAAMAPAEPSAKDRATASAAAAAAQEARAELAREQAGKTATSSDPTLPDNDTPAAEKADGQLSPDTAADTPIASAPTLAGEPVNDREKSSAKTSTAADALSMVRDRDGARVIESDDDQDGSEQPPSLLDNDEDGDVAEDTFSGAIAKAAGAYAAISTGTSGGSFAGRPHSLEAVA